MRQGSVPGRVKHRQVEAEASASALSGGLGEARAASDLPPECGDHK